MPDPANPIEIRPLKGGIEADAAAHLMADTDPWITLGRTFQHTRQTVSRPEFEVYVATLSSRVVGVILLAIPVPLIKGYIAGIAVHTDFRNRGIGSRLLTFAEERIGKVSPNVFLTVSSFNKDAQRLYERRGYQRVGELNDYILPGHSEVLMRKTTGPWNTFKPAS